MRFETIVCPACACPDATPKYTVQDRFKTIPEQKYSIVRCVSCSLLFLNPRPDEASIGLFYESSDYDPFATDSASLFGRLYKIARPFSIRRKAARVVDGLTPGARTLDVGCATGEFMLELRRRGMEPFGVEPSEKAAKFARMRHGLTVWTGGIENVPLAAGPFELISYWHVLEHVHRLESNLALSKRMLAPNGKLVIAVPNPASWDCKKYGINWVAWDTPRHLYHFEPDVMIAMLERHGFRAERAGAVAFDAFYHCLLSERKSFPAPARGVFRGLVSYLRGLSGWGGSSELYIARKN